MGLFPPSTWCCCLALSLVIFVAEGSTSPNAAGSPDSPSVPGWVHCVANLSTYVETTVTDRASYNGTFSWSPAGEKECGFQTIDYARDAVRDVSNRTVTFVGDSTAFRAFVIMHNLLANPANQQPITKVAQAPPVIDTQISLAHLVPGVTAMSMKAPPTTRLRFVRLLYASTWKQSFGELFRPQKPLYREQSRQELIAFGLGFWDFRWKMEKNSPMPNLGGPTQNLTVAQRYWAKYTLEIVDGVAHELAQLRRSLPKAAAVPVVVFRELYAVNCAASRFVSANRKYRQCRTVIEPLVVPFYRRALAHAAWSANMPVIPAVLSERPNVCPRWDGLHFGRQCKIFELQIHWNMLNLLTSRASVGPQILDGAVKAMSLAERVELAANATLYGQWWRGAMGGFDDTSASSNRTTPQQQGRQTMNQPMPTARSGPPSDVPMAAASSSPPSSSRGEAGSTSTAAPTKHSSGDLVFSLRWMPLDWATVCITVFLLASGVYVQYITRSPAPIELGE